MIKSWNQCGYIKDISIKTMHVGTIYDKKKEIGYVEASNTHTHTKKYQS